MTASVNAQIPAPAQSSRVGWLPGPLSIVQALALICVASGLRLPALAQSTDYELLARLNRAFVQVADKSAAPVVTVEVSYQLKDLNPAERDESRFEPLPPGFWRRFDQQFNRPDKIRGQGAGLVVRKDGVILTNRHVVENAEEISVRLKNGQSVPARVQATDPETDLALLKIALTNLPVARFGDSRRLRSGEFAIAIGAPLGLDFSYSFGHISVPLRTNVVMGPAAGPRGQSFIQTDLNLNPGNSGGPLLNIAGRVVGVNTLIRGMQTGIGFAIPAHTAREAIDRMLKPQRVVAP